MECSRQSRVGKWCSGHIYSAVRCGWGKEEEDMQRSGYRPFVNLLALIFSKIPVGVVIILIAGTGILFLTHTSRVPAQPPETPNPSTWITDGTGHAIASGGSVIYIGGDFYHVGPNTGTGASLSTATGNPALAYSRANNIIRAVVANGSGGWYIGGSFTMVQGVERNRLAHILADGTLDDSWNPGADDLVLALAISGGTVYVGGCSPASGV